MGDFIHVDEQTQALLDTFEKLKLYKSDLSFIEYAMHAAEKNFGMTDSLILHPSQYRNLSNLLRAFKDDKSN